MAENEDGAFHEQLYGTAVDISALITARARLSVDCGFWPVISFWSTIT
jgi:hypothetical protein